MVAFPVDRERSLDYHPRHRPGQAGRDSSRHGSPVDHTHVIFSRFRREDPSTACWRSMCREAAIKGQKGCNCLRGCRETLGPVALKEGKAPKSQRLGHGKGHRCKTGGLQTATVSIPTQQNPASAKLGTNQMPISHICGQ